jgi:hypothetical protein
MGFKLPPLSSVRVFEAAARHGSFKKAAEELNMLGVALFQRGGAMLRLARKVGFEAHKSSGLVVELEFDLG